MFFGQKNHIAKVACLKMGNLDNSVIYLDKMDILRNSDCQSEQHVFSDWQSELRTVASKKKQGGWDHPTALFFYHSLLSHSPFKIFCVAFPSRADSSLAMRCFNSSISDTSALSFSISACCVLSASMSTGTSPT